MSCHLLVPSTQISLQWPAAPVPGESEGITGDIHILCHTSVVLPGHLAGSSSQPMAGCCKPCSLNMAPKILKINCKNKIKAGSAVASLGLTYAAPVTRPRITDRWLLLVWFSSGTTLVSFLTFSSKLQAKKKKPFRELLGSFIC